MAPTSCDLARGGKFDNRAFNLREPDILNFLRPLHRNGFHLTTHCHGDTTLT